MATAAAARGGREPLLSAVRPAGAPHAELTRAASTSPKARAGERLIGAHVLVLPRLFARGMCRNIRTLHNLEPPATDDQAAKARERAARRYAA